VTTILADFRLGVIISDSSISDDDRVWSGRKVFRHKGALYGFAGDTDEAVGFMAWIKGGKHPKFAHSDCLVLSDCGAVASFRVQYLSPSRVPCSGPLAKAGSALGWSPELVILGAAHTGPLAASAAP
jgi:hypothetical protein